MNYKNAVLPSWYRESRLSNSIIWSVSCLNQAEAFIEVARMVYFEDFEVCLSKEGPVSESHLNEQWRLCLEVSFIDKTWSLQWISCVRFSCFCRFSALTSQSSITHGGESRTQRERRRHRGTNTPAGCTETGQCVRSDGMQLFTSSTWTTHWAF